MVKIYISKTKSERKIYLSDGFKRELIKLFSVLNDDVNESIIYNDRKVESKNGNISFINMINKVIKEVLGKDYSSHSFRGGLITEMGSKGVNVKLIKDFIGHKNVETTLRYIRGSDEDIKNCMIR